MDDATRQRRAQEAIKLVERALEAWADFDPDDEGVAGATLSEALEDMGMDAIRLADSEDEAD